MRPPEPGIAARTAWWHRPLALGMLVGSAALGGVATRSRRWSRLADALAAGTVLAVVPIIAAGRHATATGRASMPTTAHPPQIELWAEAAGGTEGPSVSVLVAARDEAVVLPALIADLAAQDHRDPDGTPRFRIVVVDDGSRDGTGDAARAIADAAGIGGITSVRRRSPSAAGGPPGIDGKGAALDSVPPGELRDIVIVFDADARIRPDVVRRLSEALGGGGRAVTARRRELGRDLPGLRGRLARVQDDEQTVDGLVERALWALGGGSEFRGNGMALRRDDLVASGGWGTGALCEDLDLSSRLGARCGIRVEWRPDIEVWEQPVVALADLWPQRVRWAEGIVRRQLSLTATVVATDRLGWRAKADHVAYSTQTVAPVVIAGTVVGALLGGSMRPALTLIAAYLLAGTALGAAALQDDPRSAGRGAWPSASAVTRGLAVTVFSALWIPAFVAAWARVVWRPDRIRFDRTRHRPSSELGAPPPSTTAA